MGSGALYRQEQKETLGPLRIHTRDLIAKIILRLAYSGVTDRTVGKRVFFLFPCRFRCIFLANFHIVMFPRAHVFRYVFVLCYGHFSFNL